MGLKLKCKDRGVECDFVLEGEKNVALLEQLGRHFEEVDGTQSPTEAITQMIVNRGHSLESIRK